jgi:peptidyl-prolyl cis-trans isomerase D
MINRYRNETRSVDYIALPASAAGDIPAPTDAALRAYFDARRPNYRAPEYRSIVTLAVTPKEFSDPASVADADAKKLYDEVKAQRYGTPAKRKAEQVLFSGKKAAEDASARIKGGETFAAAAKDAKADVVDLGEVTREELFDKPIADAVFSLPEGGISGPIQGKFGWVLVHVVKVIPEHIKPFEEVSADLKKEIATSRAKKKVDEIHDKIEDERTSGKTLTEAAAAVGLKPITVDAIDQSGHDKAGKEVQGLTERDALIRAVFASNIGVDNDTISTRDGGVVWFEVSGIEPARDKTFEEVHAQVETQWRDDEIAKRLSDKAGDLAKKIDAGESMENVAKAEGGLEVKHAGDVKRIGTTSVPAAAVVRIFATAVNHAGSAEGEGQSRILFKVLDSATPPLDADSDVMKTIAKQLSAAYGNDLFAEYLAKLQTDTGVTVNQVALRSATGAPDTGDN